MTTNKQLIANKKNALLSTGPKTQEGKAIVASNPIKHGIFSKQLILDSNIALENLEEYNQLLNNLIDELCPKNQLEGLIIEKIAVDFWRLRRVINFETGSIKKYLNEINMNFSGFYQKTIRDIDKEVSHKQETIAWNNKYISLLKKRSISFDNASWNNEEIESDIDEDLRLIIRKNNDLILPDEIRNKDLYNFSFSDLKKALNNNGYTSKDKISDQLIEIYSEENTKLLLEIKELKEQIALGVQLSSLPTINDSDKVLKYETAIQRSIYQNLLMLKSCQNDI